MLTASDILNRYLAFFEARGHKRISNAPLVPINDPTTLFTSSGMQALVPYLLGEKHPQGTRLVNVQNCFRAQDIEEIGDNRHTTFFRMLGNWSLGDYFKKDQLPWIFELLTDKNDGLGLDPKRLFVTVFAGDKDIPKDTESILLWQEIFQKVGIEAKENERIFAYGVEKNWWSRSGTPDKMPPGEPGGPDSEVFYDFGPELKTHESSPYKDEECHVNCDCGRYVEIANSVFMQYQKQEDGSFKELPKQNVDFGGGLERFLLAVEHKQDVFETNLFSPIIESIQKNLLTEYEYGKDLKTNRAFRIIADHIIASSFLIADGVEPSNKERGYVLRRLLRRAATQNYLLGNQSSLSLIVSSVIRQYEETDPKLKEMEDKIVQAILEEEKKFNSALKAGIKTVREWQSKNNEDKTPPLPAEIVFDLLQSQGVQFEIVSELTKGNADIEGATKLLKKHQDSSRTASAGMFKGGLADHSEKTIMGHTATHLMHQALRDVLGDSVHQTGSNITPERVRFDFNFDKRLTDEEISKVEDIVNERIKDNLPVHFELIETKKAHEMGAIGLFMDTYGEKSKIYFIGDTSKSYNQAYSIEFCGGPHVDFTGVIKSFKIIKQENLGKNQKRLYATIG